MKVPFLAFMLASWAGSLSAKSSDGVLPGGRIELRDAKAAYGNYDDEPGKLYTDDDYAKEEKKHKASKKVYDPAEHADYKARGYKAYDGYPDSMHGTGKEGYNARRPTAKAPHPTIDLEAEPGLNLPKFGHYHCFLSGAPWTACGGRSLRDFFADQCFSHYFAMTLAADGLCSRQVKEPAPVIPPPTTKPSAYDLDEMYNNGYKEKRRHPKKTQAYNPSNDVDLEADAYCTAYQQEKCLQSVYSSILLAMVQCLTENQVRVLFIEKYAKDAASNPVEGPVLYLKMLHKFVKGVIDCQPSKIRNYPTLWRTSDTPLSSYNPNAPYLVDSRDGTISLPRCTSDESSGWADMVSNQRIHCNNKGDIDDTLYVRDTADAYYSPHGRCRGSAAHRYVTAGSRWRGLYDLHKWCEIKGVHFGITWPGEHRENINWRDLALNTLPNTNPRTLRGMLDGRFPISQESEVNIRVRTIAEIVAFDTGVYRQPVLEGNGVLYYCAYYACVANNKGDTSKCFPSFSNSDWALAATETSVGEINEITAKIDYCLANDYIDETDIKEVGKNLIEELHERTHICMAETEIMNMYKALWGEEYLENHGEGADGWLVFLRKVAHEKCFVDSNQDGPSSRTCRSNTAYYEDLIVVLKKIVNRCIAAKHAVKPTKAPTSEPTEAPPSYANYNKYKKYKKAL